jgi:hypothetical protein
MFIDRPLPWFACTLLVSAAASAPALALHGSTILSTSVGKTALPAAMVAGRKGTRNYEPDDIGAITLAKHDPNSSAVTPEAQQQKLEECIASWDIQTHITKGDWRKICIRQLDDE